jgi:hypothetical protein
MTAYAPEIAKLLNYGVAEATANWPDYVRELGLGEQHIDALIRMATDAALYDADAEPLQASAPVHAWRALGQLRASSAVSPLLEVLDQRQSDWTIMEIPEVIGMIGAPALATLASWMADESRREAVMYGVIRSLVEVAHREPDTAKDVVGLLIKRLEKYRDNDFSVNAYLVEALCKLRAKEAFALIKEVYLRQRADVTIFHWDQVLEALGIHDEDD